MELGGGVLLFAVSVSTNPIGCVILLFTQVLKLALVVFPENKFIAWIGSQNMDFGVIIWLILSFPSRLLLCVSCTWFDA